jgi:hypothetical protein
VIDCDLVSHSAAALEARTSCWEGNDMGSKASLARSRVALEVQDGPQPQVGKLVGIDAHGRLLVEVPETRERLVARSLLRLDEALRRAVLERREVLLMFEGGDRRKPIVAGVLQPDAKSPSPAEIEPRILAEPSFALEADVDGNRVKLSARDEIVLECGPASITLRRNGRVIIKGVQVDSVATGTQRIRGGQVKLN